MKQSDSTKCCIIILSIIISIILFRNFRLERSNRNFSQIKRYKKAKMDEDFIRRMFGGHRFGPFDSFNRPNQAPSEDAVSPFDSLFHNDFNRMFHEMEEMMRQFHFGHFNFVESKHRFSQFELRIYSHL